MPGNRNVLYLVIGVLIVAVGVLSYNLYQGQAGTRGPADQCRPRRAEDQDQVREAVLTLTKAVPIPCPARRPCLVADRNGRRRADVLA